MNFLASGTKTMSYNGIRTNMNNSGITGIEELGTLKPLI